MNTRKWIIAGMSAALVATASSFAAEAASADVKVVATNQNVANHPKVHAIWEQLADDGYDYIKISRSMLGRAVIDAWDGAHMREIVVNMATGDIMQDATKAWQGYPAGSGVVASTSVQTSGSVAGTAAQTAGSVAGTAAQTAGSLTSTAAGTARDMVDTASGLGGFGSGN